MSVVAHIARGVSELWITRKNQESSENNEEVAGLSFAFFKDQHCYD
jgi:hypothetical protein